MRSLLSGLTKQLRRPVIGVGSVLRQKAMPFSKDEILCASTAQLKRDLVAALKSSQGGVGLAAPQIGVSKRAIVMAINEAQHLLHLFNPEVHILDRRRNVYIESCLSLPGLAGLVARPRKVRVTFLDESAQEATLECTGFFSTLVQHEVDHLDGFLYVDRLEPDKEHGKLKLFSAENAEEFCEYESTEIGEVRLVADKA